MAIEPAFSHRGEYDENWPLPKRLTLAQYRRVIFRPDAHFVDGEIVPRNLGDYVHGRAVGLLAWIFDKHCKELGLNSCISLRLQTSHSRIRVCDLVILNPHAAPEDVPTIPPLLCVEILAPDQSSDTELEVLTDYLAMGVPNIWLIDPAQRSAFTFDATGLHETDPNKLTVQNTPIKLDLTEAFAALD